MFITKRHLCLNAYTKTNHSAKEILKVVKKKIEKLNKPHLDMCHFLVNRTNHYHICTHNFPRCFCICNLGIGRLFSLGTHQYLQHNQKHKWRKANSMITNNCRNVNQNHSLCTVPTRGTTLLSFSKYYKATKFRATNTFTWLDSITFEPRRTCTTFFVVILHY